MTGNNKINVFFVVFNRFQILKIDFKRNYTLVIDLKGFKTIFSSKKVLNHA